MGREMEGKTKKKSSKFLKVAILGISAILLVILTVSTTLAWFFDADWANNAVDMAGAVGIVLKGQDTSGNTVTTSGAGQLTFRIHDNTKGVYPGQAVEVKASVFNNGDADDSLADGIGDADGFDTGDDVATSTEDATLGQYKTTSSACYVRAHFAVFTDLPANDANFNAKDIFYYLERMVNAASTGKNYKWVHYVHDTTNAADQIAITASGVAGDAVEYYKDGLYVSIRSNKKILTDEFLQSFSVGYVAPTPDDNQN